MFHGFWKNPKAVFFQPLTMRNNHVSPLNLFTRTKRHNKKEIKRLLTCNIPLKHEFREMHSIRHLHTNRRFSHSLPTKKIDKKDFHITKNFRNFANGMTHIPKPKPLAQKTYMTVSPNASWDNALALIRKNVSEQQYKTWFKPIAFESFNEQTKTVLVQVPRQEPLREQAASSQNAASTSRPRPSTRPSRSHSTRNSIRARLSPTSLRATATSCPAAWDFP